MNYKHKGNYKKILLTLLIACSLTLTGCAIISNSATQAPSATATPFILETPPTTNVPEETETPTEKPAPAAKLGGSITLSMRIPKTLNPLLNTDVTVDTVLKLIFEPLMVLDDSQKPVPNKNFVSDIVFAENYLSATITLQPAARWSDSKPITADDIIFSIETLQNASDDVLYKKCVENIVSVEKSGAMTVTVNYGQAYSGEPYRLIFPIIPKNHYENQADPSGGNNMKPLGNGFYIFKSYNFPKELLLASSPYQPAGKGRAYISEIKVITTSDFESDMNCFNQSLTDIVPGNLLNIGKYVSSRESRTAEYVTGYFDVIGFNFTSGVFQNIETRQAVAKLIPYNEIISKAYQNYAVKAPVPVYSGSWLYEPDVAEYPFNIPAAAEVLGGRRIEILVNSENTERVKAAEILRDSFNSAGATAIMTKVGFESFVRRLENRQYDIYIAGYNLSAYPDLSVLFRSGSNYSGYRSNAMDILLMKATFAVGEENLKRSISDIQKYIAENLPCVGLVFRENALMAGANILGELNPSVQNPFRNINEWFVEYD